MSKYYSFQKASRDATFGEFRNKLGPGDYKPKENSKRNEPTWSFLKDKKLYKKDLKYPGPGTYANKGQPKREELESTIGRKTYRNFHTNVPGPGNYTMNYSSVNMKQNKAMTMTSASRYNPKNNVPGPGDYNPSYESLSKNKKSRASSALPRSKRFRNSANGVPGPGDYSPTKHQRNTSFSKMNDKKIQFNINKKKTPGPGSYNYNTLFDEKKMKGLGFVQDSLGKDIRPDKKIPAPGDYHTEVHTMKKNIKNINFGQTGRFKTENFEGSKVDVGKYNPNNPDKKIVHEMQRKNNYNPKNLNPGPGDYNVDTKLVHKEEKGAEFIKDKRYHQKTMKETLGPGHYEINRDMKGKQYTFHSKGKEVDPKTPVPGPGSYNHHKQLNELPSYIKSTLTGTMDL